MSNCKGGGREEEGRVGVRRKRGEREEGREERWRGGGERKENEGRGGGGRRKEGEEGQVGGKKRTWKSDVKVTGHICSNRFLLGYCTTIS